MAKATKNVLINKWLRVFYWNSQPDNSCNGQSVRA